MESGFDVVSQLSQMPAADRITSEVDSSRDKHDAEPLASAPNYSAGSAYALRSNGKLKPIGKAPRAL